MRALYKKKCMCIVLKHIGQRPESLNTSPTILVHEFFRHRPDLALWFKSQISQSDRKSGLKSLDQPMGFISPWTKLFTTTFCSNLLRII